MMFKRLSVRFTYTQVDLPSSSLHERISHKHSSQLIEIIKCHFFFSQSFEYPRSGQRVIAYNVFHTNKKLRDKCRYDKTCQARLSVCNQARHSDVFKIHTPSCHDWLQLTNSTNLLACLSVQITHTIMPCLALTDKQY